MNTLRALMLWFHLLAAVLAIGGVYFLRLILMPIVKQDGCEHAPALSAKVRAKFRKLIWHSIGLLVISGGVLLAMRWPDIFNHRLGQHLFELKILLALALFGIALTLTIPADPSARLRVRTPGLLLVNLGADYGLPLREPFERDVLGDYVVWD